MVLGISSFTYGWSVGVNGSASLFNEQDLIFQAQKLGLRCLQVGDNLPLHRLTSEQQWELKRTVDDAKIRLEVGARGLTEDHLHQYIDLTAFYQSPLLRFVVDGTNYEPEIETIISIIKDAVPALKKSGVTLGIENHDRFHAKELSDMMEAIADVQVGICLDTVNSLGAGEGINCVTEILAPYTVNLHIKDFIIKRFPHNMGFTVAGMITGKGMLDINMVLEKLLVFNRCQSAVLEQWVPPADKLDETIELEQQWAEESIHYLKQLPFFN